MKNHLAAHSQPDAPSLSPAAGSVAAVVLTHNRRELLRRVLAAIEGQTHPVAEIIAVDNDSTDGTGAMLREHFPRVSCIAMAENLGPAGGRAAGMKLAYDRGHEWIWICDDDILPEATVLEDLLESAHSSMGQRVGMICPRTTMTGFSTSGVACWRSRVVRAPTEDGQPYEVDLATFSGVILPRKAIALAGYPNSSYFIAWEDFEYCLRLKAAGFCILVLPTVLVEHLADFSGKPLPPWRSYYQTRNHLAMALEHRSWRELFWWAVRQIKLVAASMLYLDRKRERIQLRVLGAWDGLRGRMGRTIDPAQYSK